MPKQLNKVDNSVNFLEYCNLNAVKQNMSNSAILDRGKFHQTGEGFGIVKIDKSIQEYEVNISTKISKFPHK